MPRRWKRHCDSCGEYYEGYGAKYCSLACQGAKRTREAAPTEVDNLEAPTNYELIDGKFLFVVAGKLLPVPYEQWDAICRDYSELGSNLTTAEVARKHGIPRAILSKLLSAYGQYKASPPNCRERIGEHREDFSPLVREAIENDENRFIAELERSRSDAWKSDYFRLKREEVTHDRVIAAAQELATAWTVTTGKPIQARPGGDWHAHVPTTDEHGGKLVWSKESFGDDFDTPEVCNRLRNHADQTAEWIAGQPGRCRVVHRSLLGDLFHALTGETEHGTKLDQDTRSAKVLMMVMDALVYGIGVLSRCADRVEVRGCKGNHDGFQFVFAMYALQAICRQFDNVSVAVNPGYYEGFRVGSTLHVLDHGYRMGTLTGWKAKAQAEVVAREVGREDYHGCEQIITYCGHLHEEQRGTHGGHLKLIRLPSLGESDDYETSLRYSSQPAAHLFRLDELGRISDERVLFRDRLVGA